jgi:hypothetical protein
MKRKLRTQRLDPGRNRRPPIQRLRRSRMFGWDGNPVRRRIDRLEGRMFSVLVAIFLITAPVAAAVAEHWANGAGVRLEHEERAWRQVPAIVERTPPGWQDNSAAARASGSTTRALLLNPLCGPISCRDG